MISKEGVKKLFPSGRGWAGILEKFYSGTAFIKLWRYPCPTSLPYFFTPCIVITAQYWNSDIRIKDIYGATIEFPAIMGLN
jgi:hypothetical protein